MKKAGRDWDGGVEGEVSMHGNAERGQMADTPIYSTRGALVLHVKKAEKSGKEKGAKKKDGKIAKWMGNIKIKRNKVKEFEAGQRNTTCK